jgi:arsenate reductase-like glutaredoxin family protein
MVETMSEYIHQDDAYAWLRDKEIQFAEDDFAKVQAERDALKLKVQELSTEVERLSRELARA